MRGVAWAFPFGGNRSSTGGWGAWLVCVTCQDSVAEPPCGDNFLTDLRGFLDHLKATVDPSYEYYEEFKLLAMYATMFGQAEVLPNPAATKATIVTKYSALRKMMQASVVRSSKLKPRIGLAPLEAQGADISPSPTPPRRPPTMCPRSLRRPNWSCCA